jgi:hypothetical protein
MSNNKKVYMSLYFAISKDTNTKFSKEMIILFANFLVKNNFDLKNLLLSTSNTKYIHIEKHLVDIKNSIKNN